VRLPIVLYEPPRRLRTDYRIGLSAWTDKSMLKKGKFYPYKTMSAEERLWWYSRFFDVVEVNSSFYAVPSEDTVRAWVERTPPRFLFNVKADGLLTGHHVDLARLPDTLRKMLPVDGSARLGLVGDTAAIQSWRLNFSRHVVRTRVLAAADRAMQMLRTDHEAFSLDPSFAEAHVDALRDDTIDLMDRWQAHMRYVPDFAGATPS
jgi:hypothetical protein